MSIQKTSMLIISVFYLFLPTVYAQGTLLIDIWYGTEQKIGHLGDAQDDFNLQGHVSPESAIKSLTYSVNGGVQIPLTFKPMRRIIKQGDFNADIAIKSLTMGDNAITITATGSDNSISKKVVTVKKLPPAVAPVNIRWNSVNEPIDVGQYVDGKWEKQPDGLRTITTGYDRLFLIGNKSWQDYDVTVPITVHALRGKGAGFGIIMRFTGHIIGGPTNAPAEDQPKWGYLPLGTIAWLRWFGDNTTEPKISFYGGEGNKIEGPVIGVAFEEKLILRARCETLPDKSSKGVTRYSVKVWKQGTVEPQSWSLQKVQESDIALRFGGIAFVAHNVEGSFGDVNVELLKEQPATGINESDFILQKRSVTRTVRLIHPLLTNFNGSQNLTDLRGRINATRVGAKCKFCILNN